MNKQILKTGVIFGLFLIPFIPFLVSSSLFFPFITTKAFTFRIIVEVIFALWLLLSLLDSSYRPKKSLVLYAVFGLLFIIGLADLFQSFFGHLLCIYLTVSKKLQHTMNCYNFYPSKRLFRDLIIGCRFARFPRHKPNHNFHYCGNRE